MCGSTRAGVTRAPPRSIVCRASGSSSLIIPSLIPMSLVSSSPGSRAPRSSKSNIRRNPNGRLNFGRTCRRHPLLEGEAPMQSVQEVEKHVPVREGEYGERVATVEPGGVEYIALKERHGKPIDLFWTWLSPNLEFATVFVGVIAITLFGLNFWETALAIVVGSALGSATHFVLSSWGPKFGVPMMVESRGAFGFLGNILPAGLNAFTGTIGWFIVNSVSGAFALQALGGLINLNLPFAIAFLIIVVAQVAIATLGHNFIHVFERWALPLLGIVFALATIFIFTKANFGFPAKPIPVVGEFGGFMLLFTATFVYARS